MNESDTKWVPRGQSPEGKTYFQKIKVVRLKPGQVPEPPPNFTPDEIVRTSRTDSPRIISNAQAYAEAQERKEN